MSTYGRLPVAFENGDGAWLYDTDGNKYFDTFFGIAVCGLGHSHPAVTKAIKDQAGRLLHCSNLYHTPLQVKLAQTLCQISGMEKVFFSNSGAEANEAAIKLARKYGHDKGIQTPTIIVMDQSFHGRTMATLTATGNRKAQAGFEPLLGGFVRAPFNDVKAVEAIAKSNPNVVAILVEPIQGEGGLSIAEDGYLKSLRQICDENDWLLMLDEVQTGNGRTGNYFAYQGYDVTPDVVTTAKGIANGYPIGACMAKGSAADVLTPGTHGSTFGGNPLGCAAALATINEITSHKLCDRASVLGERILKELENELLAANYVADIRGRGLMIGIELTEPCLELVPLAKAKGLLLNVTSEKVIRLLPALNMSDDECEFLIDAVVQIIRLYSADDRSRPRS
ncbi:acetylornithine aminotransferase [Oleiphilus sp. HI0081]|nr:acetylornithine aminotransferase [Oleiphilus sp. HI0043]KZY49601.1 acetylornithine aminotransferase [Oleiphilus sp. HI0050]KZY57420.1 acetylornithine aminotransferase [Oleiphilus sp. HI0061]KZY78041.1 acetylornithine aminotransferase [Oleiphilus sp. HI0068]KZZ13832.1 acetylornithine aminotransferase [Oleiphilus sp. HI0078]KZZ21845.1 acetylornithine aminotransferase [Oleiphilus sp. HI0081]KZZ36031.1 acetylornithine aminotransferase [Oleiphilus sp. HI0117]KZZ36651.1 acetylornithine aminotra